MILKTTLHGAAATLSVTDRSMTASRNDELIVAWDLGGRLYSMVDGGDTWRRGLNGRVLKKWRESGRRRLQWADEREAAAVVDRAAELARAIAAAPRAECAPPSVLTRAARFDSIAAAYDAKRFLDVYRPIGILPPDQYLALVLQATEGCSFRSCTYCDFYREPYRVRRVEEFERHVDSVLEYLGPSALLRDRSLFLGSANALAVPMSALLPIFDRLCARFPGKPVHAFLDGFTGSLKSEADYAALAARGLRRVYVGLESGHDPLLAFVGKPSTRAQAVETVRAIKAGGVNVGVIVMIGLGGDRYADPHVRETASAIEAMELGEGDLLYFSDLVETAGSKYVRTAAAAGIRALSATERGAQRKAMEDLVRFGRTRPKIARYDVREFVY